MINDIYQTLYQWVSSIFGEGVSLKIWQYIYGTDVITSRADLVEYITDMLSLAVVGSILLLTLLAFMYVIKLIIGVLIWR